MRVSEGMSRPGAARRFAVSLRRGALVALALLFPGPPAEAEPAFWIVPFGGVSWHAMADINRDIDGLREVTGVEMDHIGGGTSLGIQADLAFSPDDRYIFSYERLATGSEQSSRYGPLEYDLSADVYLFGYEHSHPFNSSLRVGVGGLMGVLVAKGGVDLSIPEHGNRDFAFSGRAFVMEARLSGALSLHRRLETITWVSYRYATIEPFTINGFTVYNNDRSEMKMDYSGPLWRLALRLKVFG